MKIKCIEQKLSGLRVFIFYITYFISIIIYHISFHTKTKINKIKINQNQQNNSKLTKINQLKIKNQNRKYLSTSLGGRDIPIALAAKFKSEEGKVGRELIGDVDKFFTFSLFYFYLCLSFFFIIYSVSFSF